MDEQVVGSRKQIVMGILAALVVVLVLGWAVDRIGATRLQNAVKSAGSLGPLIYIAVKATTYIVAPISGGPFQIASGVMFGLWPGTFYTLIADTIGGCINFLLARKFGRRVIRRMVGSKGLAKVDRAAGALGNWRALLVARLFFSAVYDFISYAAGLTSIRFRAFFLITAGAGFPATLVFVALGAGLVENRRLLAVGFLLVGILSLIPLVVKGRMGRKHR